MDKHHYWFLNPEEKLIQAVLRDDAPMVERLLTAGVNPDLRTSAGKTPLGIAQAHRNVRLAKMLIEFGAREERA